MFHVSGLCTCTEIFKSLRTKGNIQLPLEWLYNQELYMKCNISNGLAGYVLCPDNTVAVDVLCLLW